MKNKRKTKNQTKGITLIALVVTIVILLILAGVSINLVLGPNGLIAKAQEAALKTDEAQEKEAVQLAYAGALAEKRKNGDNGNVTAVELNTEFSTNGTKATASGSNPITVKFNDSQRVYTIDENGNIESDIHIVETTLEDIKGKYFENDEILLIGDKKVAIPGGATVSGVDSECSSIDEGLVIYITNQKQTINWSSPETVQETYDQFVWVPVKDALAVDMNDDNAIDKTDVDAMVESGRYPMAVKISNDEYKGVLYDFEEGADGVVITAKDYNDITDYREPDVVSYDNDDDYDYNNELVTEDSLQEEFQEMVKGVAEKGGFWVGRYETSNMSSDTNKDTSKEDFIKVVKGTTEGINNVNWYRMYAQQKNYKNYLTQSKNTKSSMIWGSQWDQIMVWMKDEKNEIDTTTGKYYITNSRGMGNYASINGVDDGYPDVSNPSPTGCFEVRKIYDLAGNLMDWCLDTFDNVSRCYRRRKLLCLFTIKTNGSVCILPCSKLSLFSS